MQQSRLGHFKKYYHSRGFFFPFTSSLGKTLKQGLCARENKIIFVCVHIFYQF